MKIIIEKWLSIVYNNISFLGFLPWFLYFLIDVKDTKFTFSVKYFIISLLVFHDIGNIAYIAISFLSLYNLVNSFDTN